MNGAPRTLYRSAGHFLRIRGTERVIHYNRFFPQQLQHDAELWELCGIRLMRQALADARAEGAVQMDVVGVEQTLSMLCGAVIHQILDTAPPGKPLVIGNCTIAMELEALKLLRPGRPDLTPTPVDIVLSRAAPAETEALARFLHEESDDAARHYPVRSIMCGPLRGDDVDPNAAMLFLNHARLSIAEGPVALRAAVEHHRRTGMTVLLLLRTSEHAPFTGMAVDGTPVELPAHYALVESLAREGVRGTHAFVEGFDQDFLVPPNEGCGLGIILLSRDDTQLDVPGLQRFPGVPATGRRELVAWGAAARHNYALTLNWELPTIAGTPEWEWKAFKREHDDILTADALARQPSRAAGSLLASFAITMTEERRCRFPRHAEAALAVRRQCEAGKLPWSGGLMLASIANKRGENALAWLAVATALLDLGSYGMPAEAAFRRAEWMFGSLLLNLHDPRAGLEVLDAFPEGGGATFASVQVAALRSICALRCDAPERLLKPTCVLLHDADWAGAAELLLTYARDRIVGRSPMLELSIISASRPLSERERHLLAIMEAIASRS